MAQYASESRPGHDNQGTVFGDAQDPDVKYWNGKLNAAYAVGFEWAAPYGLRNHFAVDLSTLTPGSAAGAVLVLRNGNDWSYGPGGIESTSTGPVVRIQLNKNGVAAVNAAAGKFFSVGGRLTNKTVDPYEGNSILWLSSSSYGVQRLLVTTEECG
jgi:hypothetical protein